MATPITIREEKLHHLIEKFGGHANVMPLACPGLMDFWKRAILTARNSMVSCAIRWNPIKRIWMRSFWDAPTYPFVRKVIEPIVGASGGDLLTAVPGQRGNAQTACCGWSFAEATGRQGKSNFTTAILPKKEKIYLKNYCTTRQ